MSAEPLRFSRGEDLLELQILGLEDPEATDEEDAGWLLVEVRGRIGGRSWAMTDPCLRVTEARELADWLEGLAGDPEPEPIEFLEPTLSFSCDPGDPAVLHVHLAAGVQPEWLEPDAPFTFSLPAAPAELLLGARRLRAAVAGATRPAN